MLMGASENASGSTDVIGLLREFGFPIFVSLWFMWRVEKRMDRFTEAIQNLLTAITVMAKTVDGWGPNGRAPTNNEQNGKPPP
jgi:hypothetical protein